MNNLFRKKSMERISSPEQLNDYIRVSTPSVWMLLATIIVLLVGVCVWGVFGHMDTKLPVAVVSEGEVVTAYVRSADAGKVFAGQTIYVDGAQGKVVSIGEEPLRVDDSFTEYMRHIGGLQEDEWVYAASLEISCRAGVHAAEIVVDSISPMSFVLN